MGRAKELYTAKQFIDAIPGSGGIVTTIAKRVGCSWNTAKKYIAEYPTIQKAYQDECEEINDMVVSVILKAIKDGDVATAKWWAARKRRGEFGDALDITSNGNMVVEVVYKQNSVSPSGLSSESASDPE